MYEDGCGSRSFRNRRPVEFRLDLEEQLRVLTAYERTLGDD